MNGLPKSYDIWKTGGNIVRWSCGHRGAESDGGCDLCSERFLKAEQVAEAIAELKIKLEEAESLNDLEVQKHLEAQLCELETELEDLEHADTGPDHDDYDYDSQYDDDPRADYAYDPYPYE